MKILHKPLLTVLLTLLFLAGALYYIASTDLKGELRLELRVKTPHGDTFFLYSQWDKENKERKGDDKGSDTVTTKKNKTEKKRKKKVKNDKKDNRPIHAKFEKIKGFFTLCFGIPRHRTTNIRLVLGEKPGKMIIEAMTLKNLFRSRRWAGEELAGMLRFMGIKKQGMENGNLYLETTDAHHEVIPGAAFYRELKELQRDKRAYYGLALLLCFPVFFFFHYVSFSSLRPFLGWKSLTNFCLLFLLVLLFPLAKGVMTPSPKGRLVEKRRMAKQPEFRLDNPFQYAAEYSTYYNDHFTFRGDFIYWHNLAKIKLFNVSPVPRVVLGKDGWLFMARQEKGLNSVDYYRNLRPLRVEELEQWKQILEERQQWLAARGIHYVFLIAPNKHTIYGEFMPDEMGKCSSRSRLDQLADYLKAHSSVPLLDIRQALINAKKNYPVYSRTDSHWNDYGAYIAHREIIAGLAGLFKEDFGHAKPLPLSRFKIAYKEKAGGDLAAMLALQETVYGEKILRLRASPPLKARGQDKKKLPRLKGFVRQSINKCENAPLPNIVMVHDSFYSRLRPFLSEHFSRILYIWDWDMNFYPEVMEKESPKLLIDEMAERFLLEPPPVNRGL